MTPSNLKKRIVQRKFKTRMAGAIKGEGRKGWNMRKELVKEKNRTLDIQQATGAGQEVKFRTGTLAGSWPPMTR
jgi:hypothetical protein